MYPRRFTHTLLVAGALIALAGCGGGTPAVTASSPGVSDDGRAAWLEVAKCMRANGYPDFPDPQLNADGVWDFSMPLDGTVPAPCDPLIRKAKTGSRNLNAPTAEEMQALRRYAGCMRDNGLPTFPDPDEDGNFGPAAAALESDPNHATAQQACKQFAPPQRPK